MKEKESIWESAKVGLVLYAQIWREILGTAVILGLASIVSYAVLAVIFVIPFLGFAQTLHTSKPIFVVIALVLAWVI